MPKPSDSKRVVCTKASKKELKAWAHNMSPMLQRDLILDIAIMGMLANWCPSCEAKHPVAPLLEGLLIALCDGDMDHVYAYVDQANDFAKTLETSLRDLFRMPLPATNLDEILRDCNIDLAHKNTNSTDK